MAPKAQPSGVADLPLPEIQRFIHREAGQFGNGVLVLECICERMARVRSLRDAKVLGEYAVWILTKISPHLCRTAWHEKLLSLPFTKKVMSELNSLKERPVPLANPPGMSGCLLIQKGTRRGFTRMLKASKGFDRAWGEQGRLDDRMKAALNNSFRAVSLLRPNGTAPGIGGFNYSFVNEGEEAVDYEGKSIGFPAALALLSLIDKKPLSSVFATGALTASGDARKVAHVNEKIRTVLREYPGVEVVIVPAQNREDVSDELLDKVRFVEDINELAEVAFGTVVCEEEDEDTGPDELLAEVRRLCEDERKFPEGMKLARKVIRKSQKKENIYERFHATWFLVDCLIHLGRLDEAEQELARVERMGKRLLEQKRIRPSDLLRVQLNRGRIPWGRFEYAKAERALRKIASEISESGALADEEARVLGTLGQVLTHAGKYEQAEEILKKAAHLMRANRDEIPREHQLLGDLYRRMGRLKDAERELDRALQLNLRVGKSGIRRQNAMYIHLARARLARAHADYSQAAEDSREGLSLSPPYHPKCLLERELGFAIWHTGNRGRAKRILGKSTKEKSSATYDMLAKVISETSKVELLVLMSYGKCENVDRLVKEITMTMKKYKPGMHWYRREIITLEKSSRGSESRLNLRRSASRLLERIPW